MNPVIETRVSRALRDEHRFFGRAVFAELVGQTSLSQIFVLALSGRSIPPADAVVVDALAAAVLVADPRIWPLKLARLCASHGSPLAGLAGGNAVLENRWIGPWATGDSAQMLLDLDRALGAIEAEHRPEAMARFLTERGRLPGIGVPLRPNDERVVAISAAVHRLGRADRRFWRLAEEAWALLETTRKLRPNVASALAAAFLDLGLTPKEAGMLAVVMCQPAILANSIEGAEQRAEALLRLPPEAVRYEGPPPRRSPRAQAAEVVVDPD